MTWPLCRTSGFVLKKATDVCENICTVGLLITINNAGIAQCYIKVHWTTVTDHSVISNTPITHVKLYCNIPMALYALHCNYPMGHYIL